jgi:hypothetical protein
LQGRDVERNEMTDKELLEFAAKAAELPECGWMGPAFMYVKDNTFTDWNPLTDDGDALRLAVKLQLKIEHYSLTSDGFDRVGAGHGNAPIKYENDPYAATRRAITRAAAEMLKGMKP